MENAKKCNFVFMSCKKDDNFVRSLSFPQNKYINSKCRLDSRTKEKKLQKTLYGF